MDPVEQGGKQTIWRLREIEHLPWNVECRLSPSLNCLMIPWYQTSTCVETNHIHIVHTTQKPCKKQRVFSTLIVKKSPIAQGSNFLIRWTKLNGQEEWSVILHDFTPQKIEKLGQLHEGCAVVYSWHAVKSPLKLDCFQGIIYNGD